LVEERISEGTLACYFIKFRLMLKNKDNLVSNIIKMRDSVGALYIHGKEPNTDMITEEAYSPFL
jgi:hypothetical protein